MEHALILLRAHLVLFYKMFNILYLQILYTLLQAILVVNAHHAPLPANHVSIRKVARVVFKDIFWQIVLVLFNVEQDFMLPIRQIHHAKNALNNVYRVEQIVRLAQVVMKAFSYSIRTV